MKLHHFATWVLFTTLTGCGGDSRHFGAKDAGHGCDASAGCAGAAGGGSGGRDAGTKPNGGGNGAIAVSTGSTTAAGGRSGNGGSAGGGRTGAGGMTGNGGADTDAAAGAAGTSGSGGDGGVIDEPGIGKLGEPCAIDGAYACAAHAGRGQLVCSKGQWASNGSGCPTGSFCDTSASNAGFCTPVIPDCAGMAAGATFCRSTERFACGADLVSATSLEKCPYVCSAAACTGECVPGQKDCKGGGTTGNGLVPRSCGLDGKWTDGTACPFLCAAATGSCVAASCGDSVKNGTETDIDCGGSCGATCIVGRQCTAGTDCASPASGRCASGRCAAATCSDAVKNGNETDVDCGGSCGATCAVTKKCGLDGDCASGSCLGGACTLCKPGAKACVGSTGVQTCVANGESYSGPVPCTVANGVPSCSAGTCGVASCGAGYCNADGLAATGCEAKLGTNDACGATCAAATACATSLSCNGSACVAPPSCASLTANCGPGANESCCTSLPVPGGTFYRGYDGTNGDKNSPATVSGFRLEKFDVTVGRFRKFLAAYKQNVVPAGAGKNPNDPADTGWSTTWNASLPPDSATFASSTYVACDPAATWTSTATTNEDEPINCVSWYEAAAFCAWDGGRLPTDAEWNYAAAGGSEQRFFPWSSPPISGAIDCTYANYEFATNMYCTPPSGAPRTVGLAPKGNGKWGQSDLAGNVWKWVFDAFVVPFPTPCTNCANRTGTERAIHGGDYGYAPDGLAVAARASVDPSGRGPVIGFRCARAQ
ncbi:MAG TPA: SUMF1/EgtB/PvdO family nonheme iron enzyme [Polyangiaceae bacterium]|jgi:formylglycine-generating enzyme required for sulfatase activity|nr:SUMF1/EgtB/PvdO family nonheme iron enzyme [Polyangiaceae bacterium]